MRTPAHGQANLNEPCTRLLRALIEPSNVVCILEADLSSLPTDHTLAARQKWRPQTDSNFASYRNHTT